MKKTQSEMIESTGIMSSSQCITFEYHKGNVFCKVEMWHNLRGRQCSINAYTIHSL